MDNQDLTAPEAVERLATDLLRLDVAYKMPTCTTAAHTLAALSAALEAAEADAEKWKRAFAAQSNKLQSVLHIEGVIASLKGDKP